MNRIRNFVLSLAVTGLIVGGGAILAALHLFGRILDRIDRRHEAEVMRRLRRPRDGTSKVSRPTQEVLRGR